MRSCVGDMRNNERLLPPLYPSLLSLFTCHTSVLFETKLGEMLITEQNTAAQHIAGRHRKQPLAGAAGSLANHSRKLLLRRVQCGRRGQQSGVRAERDV